MAEEIENGLQASGKSFYAVERRGTVYAGWYTSRTAAYAAWGIE